MSVDLTAEIIGGSLKIIANITDFPDAATPTIPGAPIDPDTHSIQVYDSTGAAVGSPVTSPSRDSVGLYWFIVQLPTSGYTGRWRVIWTIVKGGTTSNGDGFFDVTN